MTNKNLAQVFHFDLYGKREDKYTFLKENSLKNIKWNDLDYSAPNYFLVKKDFGGSNEYENGFKVIELFKTYTSGVKTHDDANLISIERFKTIHNKTYFYKPFDLRFINYDLKKVVRHRFTKIKDMLHIDNIGLVTCKSHVFKTSVLITNCLSDIRYFSNPGSIGTDYIFPLYLYPQENEQQSIELNSPTLEGWLATQDGVVLNSASHVQPTQDGMVRRPNLNMDIVNKISESLGLTFVPEKIDLNSPPMEEWLATQDEVVLNSALLATQDEVVLNSDLEKPPRPTDTPPQDGNFKKRNTTNFLSLPFNPNLKDRAKELRKAGNLSEVLFWNQVKNKQFDGLDFDRQKIIGNYIVDFYCSNLNLIIEIDGSSHNDKEDYDALRQEYLESLGLVVFRVTDVEVKNNLDSVLKYLRDFCNDNFIINDEKKATSSDFVSHSSKGGGEFEEISNCLVLKKVDRFLNKY